MLSLCPRMGYSAHEVNGHRLGDGVKSGDGHQVGPKTRKSKFIPKQFISLCPVSVKLTQPRPFSMNTKCVLDFGLFLAARSRPMMMI